MSGFEVSIDWLRFTLPSIDVQTVISRFVGTFRESAVTRNGYTKAFFLENGDKGQLSIFTGKKGSREVHVDISGKVVGGWTYEFIQNLCTFVREQNGHFGRIDVAFDDKASPVTLETVETAIRAGQSVKRSKKWRKVQEYDEENNPTGYCIYFGSRQSDTFARTYDKAAEQRANGVDVQGKWHRWELEIKNARAHQFGLTLACITAEQFKEYSVGVLRQAIDFRDITKDEESWTKARAKMLPWWEELTEGFKKARIVVQKLQKKIEDVKQWAALSLAPILAVLAASPDAGQQWIEKMIVTGPDRWKQRHYDLLKRVPKQTYVLGARA
ncbi:MAG: replication initiation factor domain-containing protein [Nitrospira sp.]|nr:replication initiation factor domain-containing protein [Nitrospira sp.]